MDFLTQILPFLYTVFGFLFVLTIVVFFHELGHFQVARWCGVGIETFSVGFGKEIFGFNDKHGTRWKFSWIPLGGYVKFEGDENEASVPSADAIAKMTPEQQARNFHAKPLWARAAVVAAGPIANFILAIVIFAFMFSIFGERVVAPRVDKITAGSAAERAGFQVGDLVKTIDGTEISSFLDMQQIVSLSAETPLNFVVERNGNLVEFVATPDRDKSKDNFGNPVSKGLLGIGRDPKSPNEVITKTYDPFSATWRGVEKTYLVISHTLTYIKRIFIGKESADQLGGPIRIAEISGQVASVGILPLLELVAILSVSIGLLNLFPVPMLDGGHLLFYGVEAIQGRPLSENAQEVGFRIGLALILMLMVFATWNDLIYMYNKYVVGV